jgi:hypothetical protein
MSSTMWLIIAGLSPAILTGIIWIARRLARLEAKIDNGITMKLSRVEERQHVMVVQVAQIHGMLASRREWDGKDRRE